MAGDDGFGDLVRTQLLQLRDVDRLGKQSGDRDVFVRIVFETLAVGVRYVLRDMARQLSNYSVQAVLGVAADNFWFA